MTKTICLALTGASGMPYGLRLLECLLAAGCNVQLLYSQAAQVVARQEMDFELPSRPADAKTALLARLAAVDPEKLAVFIDQHLGYWLPDWAQRVSAHCNTAFYAALAELTFVWLLRFRELFGEINDLPLPSREEMGALINRKLALDKAEIAPIRFVPGIQGASW